MNKYQKFFTDNFIKFADIINKMGDNRAKKLLKEQKINRDKLLTEIGKILLDYNIIDNNLDLKKDEINKIYNNLGNKIDVFLNTEYKKEKSQLGKLLVKVGNDKYNSSNYLLSLGIDFNIKQVDENKLKNIINATIGNKKYSDRIKDNKETIVKQLKKEIMKLLEGKTDVNSISDNIKHLYNNNANASKRLILNEVARVQANVNDVWLEDTGASDYMWMATLENNTCPECAELDGKVWHSNEDRLTPVEDTHIGCRCCVVAIPNKDYRPRTRLDNNTKENISWQTYKEWEREQEE